MCYSQFGTWCYLPPGRGDIHAFTPTKWVHDLATGTNAKLHCLAGRLYTEMVYQPEDRDPSQYKPASDVGKTS